MVLVNKCNSVCDVSSTGVTVWRPGSQEHRICTHATCKRHDGKYFICHHLASAQKLFTVAGKVLNDGSGSVHKAHHEAKAIQNTTVVVAYTSHTCLVGAKKKIILHRENLSVFAAHRRHSLWQVRSHWKWHCHKAWKQQLNQHRNLKQKALYTEWS